MPIEIIHIDDAEFDKRLGAVQDRLRGGGLTASGAAAGDVPVVVREIIAQVQQRGDEALLEFTAKFDKVQLEEGNRHLAPGTSEEDSGPSASCLEPSASCLEPSAFLGIQVSPEEIDEAHSNADPEFLELVRRVIKNIRQYQEHILIQPPGPLEIGGRSLGVRYTPVQRVGVYVPGGRALYPSTVLMTVVPAQVAGVDEIAIVSPPTSDGDINPMVLALAAELEVHEVYRVGGAQAVAALAVGTETVAAVDKIVGPGNAFVAEAKRQVLGRVGIDSIAGPSEVLIIADESADPGCVAADMIAQAEHDPGSAVLVTTSAKLAANVSAQIDARLAGLDRSEAVAKSMQEYGAIFVVHNFEEAAALANAFAPEHLQIVTADNDRVMASVRHAGAIFLGPFSPVPLGDYVAGPSHVLPTGGTARFFSALSCNDFLKATSVIEYNASALADDAQDVIDFATREGLTGHAQAIRARNKD
jgi:histidinol dehydrogenase